VALPACEHAASGDARCDRCLLRAALEDEEPTSSEPEPRLTSTESQDFEPPFDVDDYRVLAKIDTGGMGVVYRARNEHAEFHRALKMMRNVFASELALRLIRSEIALMERAAHPNIVLPLHAGRYKDRLYYTMKLCDGSLAQRMDEYHMPCAAARLIEIVARAVYYAHEHGVLHLDLKPANILFEGREPRIADFGLARILSAPAVGTAGASTGSVGRLGGTRPYMAPEQDAGVAAWANDIYSLGVILIELLTGSREPLSASRSELVATLKRRSDRDLAEICLKSIAEDSRQRYRTAVELAEDLRRWREHEPVSVGKTICWRRVRYVATRQRWVAAALAILALLGAALATSIQHLQSRTIDAVQVANAFTAQQMSGNVLREIDDYATALQRLSEDAKLVALVQGPPRWHTPALEHYLQGIFDSIGVYRLDGHRNARWPSVPPERYVSVDFSWRDYFLGASAAGRAGRRAAYVARCILSEGDGRNKIVLAAPLFDGDRHVGVVMATIDTAATLPALDMKNRDGEGPTGTLIGLKDRSRGSSYPNEYMVLVHEGLSDGEAADLDRQLALRLLDAWGEPLGAGEQLMHRDGDAIREADYRDPVPGFEDRWLAALAPVGRTGLAVVVRTRYRDAVRASDEMIALMAWWMLGLGGGAVLILAGIRTSRMLRRSDAPEARTAAS
jgi:serine/threonine protein kinase